jgi:hypothetical protein
MNFLLFISFISSALTCQGCSPNFTMGNQQAGFFTIYHSAVDGPEYDYNPNYNQVRHFVRGAHE